MKIGQDVLFYEHTLRDPSPGKIVHIWSDSMVNLVTWDHNGNSVPKTSVKVDKGDPFENYFCRLQY